MARKISIYAGAPIEAALADLAGGYGENRSGRLNTMAQRYRDMVADELARLDLTRAEWCALLDANNAMGLHDDAAGPTPPVIIWANIADSRSLDKKWDIDQDALVRKVRVLPRSTLVAIVEACARYWSRDRMDPDAALAESGINPKVARLVAGPVATLGEDCIVKRERARQAQEPER